MKLLRRLLAPRVVRRKLKEWHEAWSHAAADPDPVKLQDLRARLDGLDAPNEDLEIEREMLAGLEHVIELAADVTARGLPIVMTGHRVVGTDSCHFTAPVSMPDDPSQPSGRLLLTNARAIFVGGARGITVPWHAVGRSMHADRDLILVRADGTSVYRFRCNSFDDVLMAAFLARQLAGRRRV
jgi:hypothetical protein